MLKEDIAKFFEVVRDNSKLKSCLDNKYIQLYLKVINDKFINFPKTDFSNIVCFGYPNNEYLEKRISSFNKMVSEKDMTETSIRNFLSSCHSDDSTEENEYRIFYYIINKSNIIAKSEIDKLSTFSSSSKLTFPNNFVLIPFGTFINISKTDNTYLISNNNFEWLKIKSKKNFKARLIVGVKWFKKDYNYYNCEKAKWIDNLIFGVKKENCVVHILKINDSSIIKEFEKNGITTNVLETVQVSSKEDAVKKFHKAKKLGYRGILCGKHFYTDDIFDVEDYEIHKG